MPPKRVRFADETSIPKVIYQTWKTKQVPEEMQKYRNKWLKQYPASKGWKHVLLDDNDLLQLVQTHFPQYVSAYQGFRKNIERVDFARYVLLYAHGGIYSDLDVDPLKDISVWLQHGKIVLGTEPVEHARELYGKERLLCNAFMISPPRQEFWKAFMDYIITNYNRQEDPVQNTGPYAMTMFYEKNPQFEKDIIVTEPCIFYPLKKDGSVTEGCNMEKFSYVAHVWNGSWLEWPSPTSPVVLLLILFIVLWLILWWRSRKAS